VHCCERKALAVIGAKMEGRLTQPDSLVQHRLRYRLEIAGQSVDDLQNLIGGSLTR